ncbi:formate dehydrogenase subunit delta [Dyella sp.]|jgi:formate dehydrogenase subunit delta|uniref:formate dehydrogenase subunit delta n=1 Tax=Dyella sp. TaxID=1869338 RepID=UPI002D77B072|nr:formate dehydrogenase subunit delta [Dyella sp.]HET6431825.1 formate dehydrogenase subunit delta [Dyella sp.]
MNTEPLIRMVNDIASYFAAEPDHATGVAGVADHIRKFWDPTMRRAIIAHLEAGGEGLGAMGKEAVQELAARERAVG